MRNSQVVRNGEVELTDKQYWYVLGVRAGMSRRQAALAAGYSQSSANNPGWNIERRGRGGNPALRYFWDVLKPAKKTRNFAGEGNGSKRKGQFQTQVQPDQ